ncbi:MAG: NDP-sugar synthase [bacterium]
MNVYGAVLCAGFGTRMRPLTDVLPKPLLPFLNTPIVTYALQLLAEANVTRVALNLHHLPDTIPLVVDLLAPRLGVSPVYAREWDILGTAGGVAGQWAALGRPEGVLVVLNGDSVTDVELGPIIEAHIASGAGVTLVTRPKTEGQPGRVFLDAHGNLAGIRDYRSGAAVASEVEFTGIHILSSTVLSRLSIEFGDIVDELYGPMVAAGDTIRSHTVGGFWAALDTPQLLFDTSLAVMADPSAFRLAPLEITESERLWIYGPDGIDGAAQFAAPVFLGMNVQAAAGAQIGPNVVMDGTEVASGTRVRNAIIYGAGRIEGQWENLVCVAGKTATIQGA